ncbi:MAG: hypothetical protein UY98_C0040G0008 [Candidatus Kaiserbacteria bacterium GW2011_GWA2_58_9]|uniref:Uncharacterized protein n=1 Tax=Candidatus Kaiserbacteria bacterium GW2011_GWA2_58_9 TaxID=1618672 RepID=A0A0G1YQN1_9BACT|nr:MAG: hypothetical protein UY98_C0040G0008 [Candidatus Kaiserbacteria bacterium GW2011_GWA2_58_9]
MGSSQTKVIDVYGNIKSGANSGPWIATLDSTTGGTGAVTGQSVTIGSDQALQTITIGSGTLTVTRDAGTPVNSNVIAGTSNVHVGKFDFHGANSTFTVQELKIKVPNDAATSVASVTLKYKNSAGAEQTVSQALSTGNEAHATATFTGLSLYVPLNDSADLDVYVDVPTVSSGAHSGAAISVLIDADEGFKALDSAGSSDTEAASADVNSAANSGYGSKYVKKSIPTIARLTTGYTTNTVTTNIGLYRFSVAADSAGSIDWRELSFTVTTSGVVVSGFTLYDVTGTAVAINDNTADADTGTLSICPDASCTDGEAEQVGAGGSKTYELRADTVTGWGDAGDQLTIYRDDRLDERLPLEGLGQRHALLPVRHGDDVYSVVLIQHSSLRRTPVGIRPNKQTPSPSVRGFCRICEGLDEGRSFGARRRTVLRLKFFHVKADAPRYRRNVSCVQSGGP